MQKFMIGAIWGAMFFCATAQGQDREVWEEYGKRVGRAGSITAHGPELMGDQVSLSNGALSFRVTDVAIPGNSSLPVAFSRTLSVEDRTGKLREAPLGDWEIDLPNINGVYAPNWVTGSSTSPGSRCSGNPVPPTVSSHGHYFSAHEYWNGVNLNIPDGPGGELLQTLSGAPSPTGTSSVWVTGDGGVHVSCLASIQNGTGEGFLAITSDGTRYWLNWMAQDIEPALKIPNSQAAIGRRKNALYATRVEDRFGNWVTYTYSNAWNSPVRLTGIQSSDGRALSVSYGSNGRVSQVSDGTRQWAYQYSAGLSLTKVILPDNTSWTIDFDALSSTRVIPFRGIPGEPWRSCVHEPEPISKGPATGTVVHPSGAQAQFAVEIKRHGRTNVPVNCDNFTSPGNDRNDDVSFWTIRYDGFSLLSKTISGPGIAPMTWTYSYSSPWSFYYPSGSSSFPVCPVGMDCSVPVCVSDDCAGSILTTVTGPGGIWTKYRHGNSYRYNEGKLLSVETGTGAQPLRSVVNLYDNTSTLRFGASPRTRGQGFSSEYVRPRLSTQTTQDGVVFSWVANGFDAFARPTAVTKSSSLTGTPARIEQLEYHDNLAKWVVGQPSKQTVNGLAASETLYNSDGLPVTVKQFGRTVQTLTYDASSSVSSGQRGTVKTVADGRGSVTTLSSWHRGVPRLIKYPSTPDAPSGATQSAIVSDAGLITRVTDENGFATNYQYDSMGRLTQTAYPTGDSVTWNPTTLSFVRSGGAAYGLPAGHWQHTVATGNGRKVTYMDALWRPVLIREYDAGNVNGTQRFTRQTYDQAGRLSFASYPSAASDPSTGTWTEYDALNRPTSVSQDSEIGLLTTLTQYESGFRTRVTSPKGYQTITSYRAWDEPTNDYPIVIAHPGGAFTDIARDVLGKPTALTRRDSSGTTTVTRRYVYDTHQRLCKSIEPETGATILAYDAADNVVWSRAGAAYTSASSCNAADIPLAQRTSRSYDARNRILALTFPDNRGNTDYSYTPDGRLLSISTDNGGSDVVSAVYTYNRRRLPVGEALVVGAHQWSIGYGYDANGHLAAHTLPGGEAINYAPNALGQASKAGGYATGVTYFPNGAIKQFTYGNGTVHTLTQNERGLPDRSRDVRDGVSIHDDGLDYDQHGNVAAISDGRAGARGHRTMTYDALDRLTQTVSPMFGTAAYSYDVLDNLTRVRVTGGTKLRDHTYVYDANQRLNLVTNTTGGATVTTLGYDVQGNLASRNGQAYQFDFGNRLRGVAGIESYLYDGHGRRVKATRDGGRAIYSMYGQDGVLRYQRDERAGESTEYVYLGGSLVASLDEPIALATPTLTVPGYSGTGGYTVSWTASALATKYQLRERLGTGAWSTVHDGTATSKAMAGKAAGSWGYQVRACSTAVCGAWSTEARVTVQLPPTAAPVLTVPATGPNGAYTISWTAVASATKYQLQERPGTGAWSTVHDAAATSRAFSGKSAGSWGYQVRACNDAGCGSWSPAASVAVIHPPSAAPTLTTPATNLTGSYSVSWTSVATAARYELQERFGSGAWNTIHNASGTSRALTGKIAGTWNYQVRACNDAGCGAWSAMRGTSVTLPPTAVPTLTAPATNLTGAYTVSWTSVAAATRYELQERLASGAWSTIQNAAGTSRALSGKTTGSWGYRARGCNVAGCAGYSTIRTVAVTRPPTTEPVLTAPSNSATGSYAVTWAAVSAATTYQLQERLGTGSWSTIQDSSGTSRSIEGKSNGNWSYQARACNASGCGGWSAAKTVTVQLLVPSVPAGLKVTSQGVMCRVTWNAVTGATSYRLTPSGYQGSATFYQNDASCGSMAYRVAACNAYGCSAWSSGVAAPMTLSAESTQANETPLPKEGEGE